MLYIERITPSPPKFVEKHSKLKFSLQLIYKQCRFFHFFDKCYFERIVIFDKETFSERRQLKTPFPAVIVGSCQTKGTERDGHHLPINVSAMTSLKQIETRHSLKGKLRKDLTKTTLCISSVALM